MLNTDLLPKANVHGQLVWAVTTGNGTSEYGFNTSTGGIAAGARLISTMITWASQQVIAPTPLQYQHLLEHHHALQLVPLVALGRVVLF